MTTTTGKATGTFAIRGWDEQPWAEHEGAPELTQARVTSGHGGDPEGGGTGTGELAGLRGEGGYLAEQGEAEVGHELRWSIS